MSFIQLNNIVKTFNDSQRKTETLAIDDISLSFEKKRICLLAWAIGLRQIDFAQHGGWV